MVEAIEAQHDLAALLRRRGVHADPVDAMLYIGRLGGLAHFSVADDVDAGSHLLRHDLGHGVVGLGFEGRGVNRAALFLGQDQVEQRFWAGQAADMGSENAAQCSISLPSPHTLTPSRAVGRPLSYTIFVIGPPNRRLVTRCPSLLWLRRGPRPSDRPSGAIDAERSALGL